MLDAYDKARTHSKAHKLETYHGRVAEAEFRKWLINFLPKRYGVISGYIISQGVSDEQRAPHFDVIIYDQLESPILWVENNPDSSDQGRSLAIPAEYVKCVIEVKSAFKNATVNDSIEHLNELQVLSSKIDDTNERYKMYLPSDFFCYLVFFELRQQDQNDRTALNSLINGINLRGFSGALILRGEGHTRDLTAKIDVLQSETDISSPDNEKESLITGSPMSNFVKVTDKLFFVSWLLWSETFFSIFAFDTIAKLNGTFEPGRTSSFHAFGTGTTEWAETMKQKKNNV